MFCIIFNIALSNLKQQLEKVERLATAGKIARLAHSPLRYVRAMLLQHCFYPITKRGSLKKAGLFFGVDMEVLLPAATDIFLTGGKTHSSELALAKYVIANLKEGQTFLDVGAHFGYFTLLAGQVVGSAGHVVGVEPAKGSFELLSRNTHAEGNIKVLHNAVSDKNEVVRFYEFPIRYSEYNAIDVSKFENEAWMKKYQPEETEVQAVTLDGLMEQGIVPDMIKIDVEGAEVQAISGGRHLWEQHAPIVIMEYLSEDGAGSSYDKATEILRSAGYSSFMIKADGSLEQTDDILGYMSANRLTSENIVFKKDNK